MINLAVSGVPDRLFKGEIDTGYTVVYTASNLGLTLIETIIVTNTTGSAINVDFYIGEELSENRHIFAGYSINQNDFVIVSPSLILKPSEEIAFKAADFGLTALIIGARSV